MENITLLDKYADYIYGKKRNKSAILNLKFFIFMSLCFAIIHLIIYFIDFNILNLILGISWLFLVWMSFERIIVYRYINRISIINVPSNQYDKYNPYY